MYAFSQAAHAGVDVLEMDLQMTIDRVLVVHHDDTVDRTTNATGRVRDMTYEELQTLDNAYWWSEEWPSHDLGPEAYSYRGIRTGEVAPPAGYGPDDFRVETFRAVAQAFPEHVLDVEIKTPAGDDGEDDMEFILEMAAVLAAEIEELGRADSVVVVSFRGRGAGWIPGVGARGRYQPWPGCPTGVGVCFGSAAPQRPHLAGAAHLQRHRRAHPRSAGQGR